MIGGRSKTAMKMQRPSSLRDVFGVFWRYCLLLPLTIPLGLAILVVALGFLVCPPGYAVILFVEGHWILACVVLVLWGVAVYFLRHVYARLFEGSGGL